MALGNKLYLGDNLEILREKVDDETVDLIYLDPPFNSNRIYKMKTKSGPDSEEAFVDKWEWDDKSESQYQELIVAQNKEVANLMIGLRTILGNGARLAYLTMMVARLVEMHRTLKPTGSLYLHCDPTESHYLKIALDVIFGKKNFRNEITWKRRIGTSGSIHRSKKFGSITDTLLFFVKTNQARFTPQYNTNDPKHQKYVKEKFTRVDPGTGRLYQATSLANPAYRPNLIYEYRGYLPPKNGWTISKQKMELWDSQGRIHFPKKTTGRLMRKSYADENKGMPVQNLWADIVMLTVGSSELTGYPTQKPLALLERIISASSSEGDVVLDPFCGSGTTIEAAQKLNRNWIGIDMSPISIETTRQRLANLENS